MELFTLDATDLRLLAQLQQDASLSNQALAALAHVSPPTCLRRVARLRQAGLIEQQVAILSSDKLAPLLGHGLSAIAEVSLERQDEAALQAFEDRIQAVPQVQQCYRVSPGPDFVLVLRVHDMPDYLALAQSLFTAQALVRNVKTYFSVKRSKFEPAMALERVEPAVPS